MQRWNSQVVLALLVFNLLPEKRPSLLPICRFISYNWANLWFSDKLYKSSDYQMLCSSLHGYQKALNTVNNFWNTEPSTILIPRTNQRVERVSSAYRMHMANAKKNKTIELKFALSNKSYL